ncbi:MAG: pyridoxal-phosphate dependent enzyme [Bdellovibrionales bacterium]
MQETQQSSSPHPIGVNLSPAAVVTQTYLQDRVIYIVREDLLPGGTKQRAIFHFLLALRSQCFDQFVYASPFAGYAQVALAYACQILGLKCILFAEVEPKTKKPHRFTRLAQSYGAHVLVAPTLDAAEQGALNFSQARSQTYKIPLGFDDPHYKFLMRQEIRKQWANVLAQIPAPVQTLWLPVGSGTLADIFSKVVDRMVRLCCVNVHVLKDDDKRIQALRENPQITVLSSPLEFAAPAAHPPAFPSNLHYDAKIWDFIVRNGRNGDVWWNVAQ